MYIKEVLIGHEGEKVLNDDVVLNLFVKYERLMRKFSRTLQGFDEDLYSECRICFLKCLHRFKYDEDGFRRQYQNYMKQLEGEANG